MFEYTDFIYAGVSSEDMGVISCKVDQGLYEDVFMNARTINEVQTKWKDTPYFMGVSNSPIEFELTLGFQGLDNTKLRQIKQWLNKGEYMPLEFLEDTGKIYYCLYVDEPKQHHLGLGEGYITIKMRCNSCYAYTNILSKGEYDFSTPIPDISLTGSDINSNWSILSNYSYSGEYSISSPFPAIETITTFSKIDNTNTTTTLEYNVSFNNGSTWNGWKTVINNGFIDGMNDEGYYGQTKIKFRECYADGQTESNINAFLSKFYPNFVLENVGDIDTSAFMNILKVGNGDVEILNRQRTETFILTDITDQELIYVDSQYGEMGSNITGNLPLNNHNDVWIKMSVGKNYYRVTGNCKLSFEYECKYLA